MIRRRAATLQAVLSAAAAKSSAMLARLEQLIKWRIHREARVLLCTTDSTGRLAKELLENAQAERQDKAPTGEISGARVCAVVQVSKTVSHSL